MMKKKYVLIGALLIIILVVVGIVSLRYTTDEKIILSPSIIRYSKGLEQNENANFIVHVLNSGEINPIDIKVYVDDDLKIDADFENESTGIISITPHITLYLQLEKGIHTIKAISTAGEAIFEQEFEIVDKHWAILGYEYWWGIGEETPPKHFEFIIRTDPIYFE